MKKIQDDLNMKNELMLQEVMAKKNIPIYQQEAVKEILSSSRKKLKAGVILTNGFYYVYFFI